MIVLDCGEAIEVYSAGQEDDDEAFISIATGPDDSRLEGTRLVARLFEDGTCLDANGRKLDGLRFYRAYRMALISRSLEQGSAAPAKVYYSPIYNEYGIRIGITAELLYCVREKRTRDMLLSRLFDIDTRFPLAYSQQEIADHFDLKGIETHSQTTDDKSSGKKTIVLALGVGAQVKYPSSLDPSGPS